MKDAVFDDFIDRLRSQSDIVSVISEYVPLKKRGKNYWGCCPFHHEKTPSFSVTPDKGFFYCFGCQSGGNVFNFLMKLENLTFMEAVKKLAAKLNVPVPEKEKSEQERQAEREMAGLLKANATASDFFHACLTKTSYGKAAREYLKARGVDDETVAAFRLGFAPKAWDKLTTALTSRGFTADALAKAGLAVARTGGDGVYDRFRDRIMFPIADARGRVIGFGGRVMDGSQPKYLNTAETPVFNKRYVLYGFDLAYQAIKQAGKAIVVEGYMDLIALHASGIKNAVASLGTSFTPEQARQLARHVEEIYFAYDSDAAGQNATLRALATVRALGLAVRVITLPDGKDPDEFIRRHGADAFRALMDQAPALLAYQVSQALQTNDYSSASGKMGVLAQAIPALAEAPDLAEVNEHIRMLSQTLGIHEEDIRREIRKNQQKDKAANRGQNSNVLSLTQKLAPKTVAAERQLIRLMLEDRSVIPYVQAELTGEDIQGGERKTIINSLFTAYNMGKSPAADGLALGLPEAAATELSNIMVMEIQLNDISRVVDDCIRIIRVARLEPLIMVHSLRAEEFLRLGDESNYRQELAESQRIKDEISKLHQA
ncbi:DNA primase [Anaeroselena agilis]|uniref:DNA primase n=1 Tax=Anaeroselena agilis TaxID=3063788 RepID=A0ABU3NYQ1_9FIRM|nr:DNA primase [Selenomonadales bacterium 4137-cl]